MNILFCCFAHNEKKQRLSMEGLIFAFIIHMQEVTLQLLIGCGIILKLK